ncbi:MULTISPECIES: aspartate/glutamate racemase family protein [Sphingopyxis]|mgnify:FL=1|jgi:aspartate racemase|uniref:aspartate/glutamate racemase family protein n=1 Tax=Sphingopyxis TaxID=165697 RepID=UPI00082B0FA1|nr:MULTISPECIES: amino acid racemase [Sphingopyxis]APW72638.1 aspartate racemase [Sphingopyxis granuli]AVA13878.1 aspartate racemase [Sphingopyxis sp. MG]ODU29237.1 MAG: aspartate racemase [Sphingopyxis sp. SCN 67-31]
MRKIGLIGGMSWASTELYYRHLNKGLQKRIGSSCSAPILLESLNYCDLSRLTTPEQWAHAQEVLIASARRLEKAGATALMIAANSMHKVAEEVAAAIAIPLIHIVDETGAKMRADGIRTAAVIGTRNVMTEPWFRQRLVRHGLTLAPYDADSADAVDRIIYDELMQGRVTEDSRRTMRTIITDIAKQDVQALVLACTELVMLVDPDANVLPIYDTTRIHVAAGIDWILGDEP